jgi:hypothetical protein
MKFALILIILATVNAEELSQTDIKNVSHLIDVFKSNDSDAIANSIAYPLKREYPISIIRNKNELMLKFESVFSNSLKSLIIKSTPSDNWSRVGYRGVMLNDGDVWIDDEGKILAINITSPMEQKIIDKRISDIRNGLNKKLQAFKRPVCDFVTKSFRIRIDEVEKGYRYASWKIKDNESQEPQIILFGGEFNFDGSGGSGTYIFKNGRYIYRIYSDELVDAAPAYTLEVYDKGKVILSQPQK